MNNESQFIGEKRLVKGGSNLSKGAKFSNLIRKKNSGDQMLRQSVEQLGSRTSMDGKKSESVRKSHQQIQIIANSQN